MVDDIAANDAREVPDGVSEVARLTAELMKELKEEGPLSPSKQDEYRKIGATCSELNLERSRMEQEVIEQLRTNKASTVPLALRIYQTL